MHESYKSSVISQYYFCKTDAIIQRRGFLIIISVHQMPLFSGGVFSMALLYIKCYYPVNVGFLNIITAVQLASLFGGGLFSKSVPYTCIQDRGIPIYEYHYGGCCESGFSKSWLYIIIQGGDFLKTISIYQMALFSWGAFSKSFLYISNNTIPGFTSWKVIIQGVYLFQCKFRIYFYVYCQSVYMVYLFLSLKIIV